MIAAQRPEMRFVGPKSGDQQARAVLFRSRDRLVHQRTGLVNAVRAMLYEYGHVFATGPAHLKGIGEVISDPARDLPTLVIADCRDLLAQISEKSVRIEAKTRAPRLSQPGRTRRGVFRPFLVWGL